jgi:DNA-directed RNA polymerase subunit RPC12/RpoP
MNVKTVQSENWTPPPGFLQIDSALEGVTVYSLAPKSEEPETDAPKTYTCPNCGATTSYDVSAGGVACEYCGYVAPSQVEKVGRKAKEFEFTLATLQQAEKGWGVVRKELHCDNCGANLSLAEGALTATCPFCASNKVNVRAASFAVLRPRFLIPFKIKPETTRARAQEWLGKGWFHPSELGSTAAIDRFTGIYLPFWTFDARINAKWRAEVGHERTESYYDAGSKSWRTRTVIDWRWESGQVEVNIDDLLLSGSTRLSRRILENLYPFNLGDLVAYTPDFLAGWQAHAYDITLPDAWETAKERMREQGKDACYKDIHSSHVRNFSMTADFANETWRYILLPVYIAAYKFENTVFQIMVNGQTGVVAGQKPVAWWKIWLAVAILLAPGLFLGLLGLPGLAFGGVGVILLVLGFVLLIIGAGISIALYRQAIASEAA